jgi:hypothetical protein
VSEKFCIFKNATFKNSLLFIFCCKMTNSTTGVKRNDEIKLIYVNFRKKGKNKKDAFFLENIATKKSPSKKSNNCSPIGEQFT